MVARTDRIQKAMNAEKVMTMTVSSLVLLPFFVLLNALPKSSAVDPNTDESSVTAKTK